MVQLNPMVVKPHLVVRLRDASPPMAQTDINSVTEAAKNWELVLGCILATKCQAEFMMTLWTDICWPSS